LYNSRVLKWVMDQPRMEETAVAGEKIEI